MPADPTPADARALAEEALILAGATTAADTRTLARALIQALDELAEARQLLTDEGVPAEKKLADWISFALLCERAERDGVAEDRDALLADLPHAVGTCGCEQDEIGDRDVGFMRAWPAAHTAAIARLEGRIK